MQLFYAPDITPPLYTLSDEESKHCVRVLRLSVGDELHITDGKGNKAQRNLGYDAQIADVLCGVQHAGQIDLSQTKRADQNAREQISRYRRQLQRLD